MTSKYISQAAFAKLAGVSRQAINSAIKSGLVPTVDVKGKRRIDPSDYHCKSYIKNKFRLRLKPEKTKKVEVRQSFSTNVIKKIDGGRYFKGALRQAILERDNFKCVLCGGKNSLEIDHIIEYEDGGKTTFENGQTLCAECNKGKHSLKNITKNAEMISQYEFSKRVGVDRGRISRAIDSDILESDKNGKINYTTEIIKWYEYINPTQHYNEKDIPEYIKKLADSGELTSEQIDQLSKQDFEKIKIYEQIKQIRVKTQRDRDELISRKLVRVVFGKLHEIDTNQFLTVKGKVVPDLAGIFGCTDSEKMIVAEKRIDEEMWKILKHIKHDIDKFLKKCGEEHV